MPGKMAGGGAQGLNLLRAATEMLGKAIGLLPLGSEDQKVAADAFGKLSKHVGEAAGGGDPAAMIQQLAQLARAKQQAAPPSALGGGGAPPPMGGGGGMPPPMAA